LFATNGTSDRVKPSPGYVATSAIKRYLALDNQYLVVRDFPKAPRRLGSRGIHVL
jgi:hypothetical protein